MALKIKTKREIGYYAMLEARKKKLAAIKL